MKKCKKNFSVNNKTKGYYIDETEIIYLYNIVNDKNEVIYVGITSDIKQTKNRHFNICDIHNAKIKIVGSFYDRDLAEFIEMQLIKEYLNNGVKLLNKVTEFTLN